MSELERIIDAMRARAQEFRDSIPGVPCQCDTSWHADEIYEWADQLAALSGSPGSAPERTTTAGEGDAAERR